MDDHTKISIVAIAAGVVILVVEMFTGNIDTLMTSIAAAAIGGGIGVPIGSYATTIKNNGGTP